LGGTKYGIQNSNIPKAGQALSEPYKPNKVAGAGSSSFDYSNFGNVLKSIKEEQDVYKRVTDPNFKLLSEDEMSKLADERFKKEWANRSWQDLYKPIDPAQHEKIKQGIIKDIKAGKQSKVALGMFERNNTNEARRTDAMSLFNRSKDKARASYLNELRADNATRQYFDTEEGKKRTEAGKKLLDFYGTYSPGSVSPMDNSSVYGVNLGGQYGNSPFLFDERYLKAQQTGENLLSKEYMGRIGKTAKDLAGLTPYQQAYLNELNKQKGTGQSIDFNKIRDTIAGDFNKSVGLTGEFVPFGYNKFNVDALRKSY
jgi:hypothetical protein